MSHIPISAFVNVSISSPVAGLSVPAINNIAILTKEAPVNSAITISAPGIYSSPLQVLTDWGANSEVYSQAQAIFSQNPCITDGGGVLIIAPIQSGDTISDGVAALYPIQYFGTVLYAGYAPNDAELIAAAVTCQSTKVNFIPSSYLTSSLTTTTGVFWIINAAGDNYTDPFLYLIGGTALAARIAAAAYAGRKRSVDFNGIATTTTMHGKSLAGVTADTLITQALLATCQTVGVQAYVSVGDSQQYLGKVFSAPLGGTGGLFPDSIYNRQWLTYALQTAVFNVLTGTSTKIPQTEPGMASLRGACLDVLNQAVRNGYLAPGNVWNSATVFGDPASLRDNITNVGYYIYSAPISLQTQATRAARIAPLIQIAGKEAGAIQSSNIIGYIEQ